MASLNQATLIGYIGQEPRAATSSNGGRVVSFSLATTEKGYTKQDGTKTEDQTEWHNIVLFGKIAEIGEKYLRKGSFIFIQGKMKTRMYEDKKDGIKRYITEIVGSTLQFLDLKEKSQESQNKAGNQSPYYNMSVSNITNESNSSLKEDEDLPF